MPGVLERRRLVETLEPLSCARDRLFAYLSGNSREGIGAEVPRLFFRMQISDRQVYPLAPRCRRTYRRVAADTRLRSDTRGRSLACLALTWSALQWFHSNSMRPGAAPPSFVRHPRV